MYNELVAHLTTETNLAHNNAIYAQQCASESFERSLFRDSVLWQRDAAATHAEARRRVDAWLKLDALLAYVRAHTMIKLPHPGLCAVTAAYVGEMKL